VVGGIAGGEVRCCRGNRCRRQWPVSQSGNGERMRCGKRTAGAAWLGQWARATRTQEGCYAPVLEVGAGERRTLPVKTRPCASWLPEKSTSCRGSATKQY